MAAKGKGVPEAVIRRLTRYLAHVQELRRSGVEWVSSHEMAEALEVTSSTVRQDLSHVDFSGISKRGYETEGLEAVLEGVLGADSPRRVVVVGAGNLGRALALHEEFSRRGFLMCGIFDGDNRKTGAKIGDLAVRIMQDLPKVVRSRKVDIGIIAVPPSGAQAVADLLVQSGVRGILNMALTHIVTTPEVPVVDARIVSSLLELSHAIKYTRPQAKRAARDGRR